MCLCWAEANSGFEVLILVFTGLVEGTFSGCQGLAEQAVKMSPPEEKGRTNQNNTKRTCVGQMPAFQMVLSPETLGWPFIALNMVHLRNDPVSRLLYLKYSLRCSLRDHHDRA